MSDLYGFRITEAAKAAAMAWKHYSQTGEMPLRDVIHHSCCLGANERADQHRVENYLMELGLLFLAEGEK